MTANPLTQKSDHVSNHGRRKTASRRTIKSRLSIHDRTQIEAVFDYYLFRGAHLPRNSQKLLYQIDAYFFFPQQFGLNESTYSKIQFFNDIRPLIRLREPKIGLKELRGLKNSIYPSPLQFLQETLTKLLEKSSAERDKLISQAIVECRIFSCVFVSAILRNVSQWEKKLRQLNLNPPISINEKLSEYFNKLDKLISKINLIINDLHTLREKTSLLPQKESHFLVKELSLADEYFYYRISDALSQILKYSEPLSKQFVLGEIDNFHQSLIKTIAHYTAHARRAGYTVMSHESSSMEREKYLKRRSELKKRFWAVFFLNLRTTPFFPMQQQLGPMLAAGLAAIWAAFAQLFILDKMLRNQNSFSLLEVSSLIIVFSAMFAYIIKDRIKEIGRNLFKGRIFRRIPDQSETIYYQNKAGEPQPIGRLTESAQFIKNQKLPQIIKNLRGQFESQSLELEDSDNILHYSKEVTLNSQIHVHNRYLTRVIHDILRFTIDPCLPRLAEPQSLLTLVSTESTTQKSLHGLQVPTSKGTLEVQFIECPKTYTFDLVLQYSGTHQSKLSFFSKSEKKLTPYTKYYRVTLNKSGLLRIENLRNQKNSPDIN